MKKEKNQIEVPEEIIPLRKYIITVDDMEKSGFSCDESERLINDELRVFKDWLNTLKDPSNIEIFKRCILKFAYFLLKEQRITTPTQNTIISFYKIHLIDKDIGTIKNHLTAIKKFFEWTATEEIYPNIAINCRTSSKEVNNDQDIPILYNNKKIKVIPEPSNPLIRISYI